MASTAAKVLVLFVAAIHIAIAVTEIFFWESPAVYSRLEFTSGEAEKVAPIVANAGLYNGFLAAGLIWALFSGAKDRQIGTFFLLCVIVAGVFGAVTLKVTTLVLQSVPGGLALLAVWFSAESADLRKSGDVPHK
jgi:putative membrane protein